MASSAVVMQWRTGTVQQVRAGGPARWSMPCGSSDGAAARRCVRALAYTALVGEPAARRQGAAQRLRAAAGSGHGRLGVRRRRPRPAAGGPAGRPGHIVKARYTPQQQMFLAVDEQDSPHHDGCCARPATSPGCPSSWPTCTRPCRRCWPASAPRPGRPGRLPHDRRRRPALAFSRTVAGLTRGRVAGRHVTVGQAYGGDHEAVTLHSGPARGPPRARRRHGGRGPGPGQRRAPARVGLLRRRRRRGAQCRRRRSAAGGVAGAARLGCGRARAAPRDLPPQPHGIRTGRLGAGGRAGAAAARRLRRAGLRARPRSSCAGAAAAASASSTCAADGLREALRAAPRSPVDDGPRAGRGPRGLPRTARRPGGMPPGCWDSRPGGRGRTGSSAGGTGQRTSTRSTTKISVSPGLIAAPAPRSP